MAAVNDDTIHAVSMVATFDRTGTMILAGSSDLREEPVLEPVTRCVISAPERLHCLLLCFVVVDNHGAPLDRRCTAEFAKGGTMMPPRLRLTTVPSTAYETVLTAAPASGAAWRQGVSSPGRFLV